MLGSGCPSLATLMPLPVSVTCQLVTVPSGCVRSPSPRSPTQSLSGHPPGTGLPVPQWQRQHPRAKPGQLAVAAYRLTTETRSSDSPDSESESAAAPSQRYGYPGGLRVAPATDSERLGDSESDSGPGCACTHPGVVLVLRSSVPGLEQPLPYSMDPDSHRRVPQCQCAILRLRFGLDLPGRTLACY